MNRIPNALTIEILYKITRNVEATERKSSQTFRISEFDILIKTSFILCLLHN